MGMFSFKKDQLKNNLLDFFSNLREDLVAPDGLELAL